MTAAGPAAGLDVARTATRRSRRDGGTDGNRALRDVFARYATGVCVLTTTHRGRQVGVTVNSFTSVSLAPPLVLWCLQRSSASSPAFASSEHFAVNVLGAGQRDLAVRFAGPGDRFGGVDTRPGEHGVPLLSGAVATLVCRRDRLVPAGDHLVLFGEVLAHHTAAGAPLLFVDSAFHTC